MIAKHVLSPLLHALFAMDVDVLCRRRCGHRNASAWAIVHCVDRIAADAGVAPTTLYRLFASKDDLVAHYVERADHRYRQWFHAATEAGAPEPGNQILAVFDALADQVQPRHCRGCPFLMALAEFPDTTHRAPQLAVANKRWVRGRFEHLARQLETTRRADGPSALADHLALLMDGVYASTQALGHTGPARRARGLAEQIVSAAR